MCLKVVKRHQKRREDIIWQLTSQENNGNYTIIPAYFKGTPCGISKKDRRIFYKDELIKDAKYDEGEIYSNTKFAKKMLSLRVGSSFKWMDDDEDLCTYLLIEKVEI